MHARCCEALLDTGSVLSASTSIQICVDRVQDWSLTVENCHVAAYVFCVSARIALRTEQTIAARFQFEKSLHCYQQVRDRAGYAFALYSIAQIDMRQGLLEEARQKYIESLAIFLEYDSHLLAGCGYYFLGYLERIAHRYESALHKFLAGLILFGRMGNTGSIVGSVTEIAKVALVKQQYLEACRLFGMADFLRESIGETQWKALPAEYAEYEQHIAQLHQNLDSDLFRKAWQEGHAIATGDLIGYVTNFIAPP
jgi:tetratricopeptide (TPR) repeat protein